MNDPPTDEPRGRILRFRPRGALPTHNQPPASPVKGLDKYERPEGQDDYRHRMVMNGVALAATIALVLVGIWIADTMAHMRKDQDCVLSGRRNCAQINVLPAPR